MTVQRLEHFSNLIAFVDPDIFKNTFSKKYDIPELLEHYNNSPAFKFHKQMHEFMSYFKYLKPPHLFSSGHLKRVRTLRRIFVAWNCTLYTLSHQSFLNLSWKDPILLLYITKDNVRTCSELSATSTSSYAEITAEKRNELWGLLFIEAKGFVAF